MHADDPEALLVEDHAALGARVAELCAALERADMARSFELLDLVWARLAVHIRAEHLCLFQTLMDASAHPATGVHGGPTRAEVERTIGRLRHDHDLFMRELADAMQTMRELKSMPVGGDTGPRLRAVHHLVLRLSEQLALHNELEESRIYKWAARLLALMEQAQLFVRMQHELEHLPPRFQGPPR